MKMSSNDGTLERSAARRVMRATHPCAMAAPNKAPQVTREASTEASPKLSSWPPTPLSLWSALGWESIVPNKVLPWPLSDTSRLLGLLSMNEPKSSKDGASSYPSSPGWGKCVAYFTVTVLGWILTLFLEPYCCLVGDGSIFFSYRKAVKHTDIMGLTYTSIWK